MSNKDMEWVFEQMELEARRKLLFQMKNSRHALSTDGNVLPDVYFHIRVVRNDGYLGNRQGEVVTAYGIYGDPAQYGMMYWDIKCECRLFGRGFGEMKAKAKKGEFDFTTRTM